MEESIKRGDVVWVDLPPLSQFSCADRGTTGHSGSERCGKPPFSYHDCCPGHIGYQAVGYVNARPV